MTVFFVIVGFDQALKYCTFHHIQAPLKLFSLPFNIDLSIHLATNTGGPWGIFSQWQMALLVLRIGLCVALIAYLVKAHTHFFRQVFLTLILAGALSNIFDTFFYGFVIDMIHFTFSNRSFGIFNLADTAIFIGIVISIFEPKRNENAATE